MAARRAKRVHPARRAVLLAIAWCAATALATVVTWQGVSFVGARVTNGAMPVLSQAAIGEALRTTKPSRGSKRTKLSTPAVEPQAPTAEPRPSRTPTPTATRSPRPPATAEPRAITSTWQVAGGQVSARCRGQVIALLYATPTDGWNMEIEQDGPVRVEVHYESRTAESELTARCVGGRPTAQVGAEGDATVQRRETQDDGGGWNDDPTGGSGTDDGLHDR